MGVAVKEKKQWGWTAEARDSQQNTWEVEVSHRTALAHFLDPNLLLSYRDL